MNKREVCEALERAAATVKESGLWSGIEDRLLAAAQGDGT